MTEQTVEQRETEVVLEYEYRQDELTDAVRLMLRKRGRAGILYRPVFLVCVGLLGAAQFALGVLQDDVVFCIFGGMFVFWPVLMARVPRITARQLLRANQHHGVMRVTVGEQGVRTVSTHADIRLGWANYGSYAETDRCFVLRSPDRIGACAAVLVKRGAHTPEDVDRLRALLDRSLSRV
ncbi:YcxB family protein [Streptomyces cyslabdanicus]|uniref:YcxB family protein n=1 Tax=Streptomyces cyslabdanicus TaxID=1470456 RepID=UPI004043C298